MLSGKKNAVLALGMALAFLSAIVGAQETVYKWVDKDGVVHFSDAPPDEPGVTESETLTTAKAPAFVPPASTDREPRTVRKSARAVDPEAKELSTPPLVPEASISDMSLEDLEQRCEAAREKRIAPLRQAEISKCKATEDTDPARCERFWADYGDGGRTVSGGTFPRLFHDLPECVEALSERNRRGL